MADPKAVALFNCRRERDVYRKALERIVILSKDEGQHAVEIASTALYEWQKG